MAGVSTVGAVERVEEETAVERVAAAEERAVERVAEWVVERAVEDRAVERVAATVLATTVMAAAETAVAVDWVVAPAVRKGEAS